MSDRHRCVRRDNPFDACGPSVNKCVEDERGEFWIGNDEYASQVNFCPFCGARSLTPTPPCEHDFVDGWCYLCETPDVEKISR